MIVIGVDVRVDQLEDHWNLYAKGKNGDNLILCNRYGWSEHNCPCDDSKTGLILYPKDMKFKNIVLLVCQNCYGFQQGNGTQHEQLCKWYYKIYGDSKSFALLSGFARAKDGSFKYNSSTYNQKLMYGNVEYSDGNRIMNELEQKIVQEVVINKHRTYDIVKAISQGKLIIKKKIYIFFFRVQIQICSNVLQDIS